MRVETVICDHCGEHGGPTREAEGYLRIHVQANGKKYWADLCGWDCGADFFRQRGQGATEGAFTEEE